MWGGGGCVESLMWRGSLCPFKLLVNHLAEVERERESDYFSSLQFCYGCL